MPVRVGACCIDITPPIGVTLSGHGDRKPLPSIGVADPLYAGAMAVDTGEQRWVLLTSDLGGVDAEMTHSIRDTIEKATGVPGSCVTVTASHTHSGPRIKDVRDGFIDSALREVLVRKLAGAAICAVQDMIVGRIGIGCGKGVGIGKNRRHPEGPNDERVIVIREDSPTGRPLACVTAYDCHPTVLDRTVYHISADYPGYYRKFMEKVLGNRVSIMFANGAAGNISTRWTRRECGFAEAERIGSLLGAAAMQTFLMTETSEELDLRIAQGKVILPSRVLPTEDEAQRSLEELTAKHQRLIREGAPVPVVRTADLAVLGAQATLRLVRSSPLGDFEAEIQCIRLDDTILVALPVELFVEYGLELQARFPSKTAYAIGYANGSFGYVPTPQAFEEGGYEVFVTRLGPDAGRRLVDASVKVVQELL